MKTNLPNFSTAHVLVVGDVMLDRYWYGSSKRISPEAPVPVVHVKGDEQRAGGASNVALNITALGARSTLLGMTGEDANADALQALLQQHKVDCHFLRTPQHDTCLKLRVIAQNQQMIRLDFEDHFTAIDKTSLNQRFDTLLDDIDVVILSDYAKGTLSDIETLIQYAHKKQKPIIIDPKGSDFKRYRGTTLITPNRLEFETVVGFCTTEAELVSKAEQLLAECELEALLITRGEEGMSLIQKDQPPYHLPTYAREVFDVTGAGDTVIGTLATALASQTSLQEAVSLANLAAGLVVRKLGTATTSIDEMSIALQEQQAIAFGIISENELQEAIKMAHKKGEKVIMTNGCFDIMHVGHVDYLKKARALGHRLVVAVNSDQSVRQLKGNSRPINSLEHRMAMLMALECVDWVVPFTEETPERLYCKVLPDTIVKGGDYAPDEVVGGDCVHANGGDVQIIEFVSGHSTTNIINKIKR